MPAYVETGLNVVHVDDVAEGHLLALERGRVGERYILGCENLTMAQILALVDEVTGRPQRRVKLSRTLLWPLALGCEGVARLGGPLPLVSTDELRMSRKLMYFSAAKARAELGFSPRPAREAIADAVAWFREHRRMAA
jgi:dihydroflavonol-4-reductase